MLSLRSFALRNFRSFAHSGPIDLARLTILVGKNSSGKSSIARFLPLLRQSMETRTSQPFLWYGDAVDFGSFSETRRQGADRIGIDFSFGPFDPAREDQTFPGLAAFPFPLGSKNMDVRLEVAQEKDFHYIQRVELKVRGATIHITQEHSGRVSEVFCNDQDLLTTTSLSYSATPSTLIPRLECETNDRSNENLIPRLATSFRNQIWWREKAESIAFQRFYKRIHDISGLELGSHRLANTVSRIRSPNTKDFIQELNQAAHDDSWPRVLAIKASSVAELLSDGALRELQALRILSLLPEALYSVQIALSEVARGTSYVGPFRATASRFTRKQALAVDRIDHRGANLLPFISGQSKKDLKNLKRWIRESLEIDISVASDHGHSWLTIAEDQTHKGMKLADVGFGYSQVLPLAVQLWNDAEDPRGARGRAGSVTVIEQPELHLHPDMQARTARMVSSMLSQNENSHAIIETHSEAFINEVGRQVRSRRLRAEDVQILLVNRPEPVAPAQISKAHFDDDGHLTNWPFGFLSPGV